MENKEQNQKVNIEIKGKIDLPKHKMENKEQNQKVNIEIKGKIDLPKLEVKEFIGHKVIVEDASVYKGEYGYYVKMTSEPVTFLTVFNKETKKEEQKPICASVMLSLQEDKEGNIGWGEGTKLDNFLKANKVNHFSEMVGKTVVLQTRMDKEGNTFLTF